MIATRRFENKSLWETGWRSRPILDVSPNPKALTAGCEKDHSLRNASLETSDIWKGLGRWPVGCVWHPWLDPLASPSCPWPWAELLLRCQGHRQCCFLSWEFFGQRQPAIKRSYVIWGGLTQLDEQTGFKPCSQRHVHILLIQTFVRDSTWVTNLFCLAGMKKMKLWRLESKSILTCLVLSLKSQQRFGFSLWPKCPSEVLQKS